MLVNRAAASMGVDHQASAIQIKRTQTTRFSSIFLATCHVNMNVSGEKMTLDRSELFYFPLLPSFLPSFTLTVSGILSYFLPSHDLYSMVLPRTYLNLRDTENPVFLAIGCRDMQHSFPRYSPLR